MTKAEIQKRITELEVELEQQTVKMNSLKVTINGSFGKLGSPYSVLYSPDLMVQVTVTGQLSLLMLIETFESRGFSILSANTDGIVIRCPTGKEPMMKTIINRWEMSTGFTMESANYLALYSRDVNNYIAIKPDGEVKTKGCFGPASVEKSPENDICSIALIAYIKYGTPLMQTIKSCFDISKFLMLQHCAGGAEKDGVYLGKAIRWYHAKGEPTAIYNVGSKDKVGLSDNSKPFMDLSMPFPKDIDYAWYESQCHDLFYPKNSKG